MKVDEYLAWAEEQPGRHDGSIKLDPPGAEFAAAYIHWA
jgi:hypothetical protein